MGTRSAADEAEILRRFRTHNPLDGLDTVTGPDDLLRLEHAGREVHVSPAVEDYIVAIVRATRAHPEVELGASPRGSLGLYRTAQALAAIRGRSHVLPDDVQEARPAGGGAGGDPPGEPRSVPDRPGPRRDPRPLARPAGRRERARALRPPPPPHHHGAGGPAGGARPP